MEQVVATIHKGDTVLVEDVDIWIENIEFPSSHLGWEGRFTLPEGVYLDIGGPYRLETADHRSAQINITYENNGEVEFQVTGTFG